MKAAGDVYIAGSNTMDDWKAFRNTLASGGDSEWKSAFEEYFHQRLSLRYSEPIRVLQDHGTFQGEGSSIVAIQCTLIEFLASTVEGKITDSGEKAINRWVVMSIPTAAISL